MFKLVDGIHATSIEGLNDTLPYGVNLDFVAHERVYVRGKEVVKDGCYCALPFVTASNLSLEERVNTLRFGSRFIFGLFEKMPLG